ncbi:SpoIIIAH-like family protein [Ornithinibacillus gellani]|uniref:SpoIIIAH-like family protein n=1 Tax=Ornithinibacillus gellani TaxID=2293253 RepID=UPI000F49216F|nr:SpoIIIAH-like family protein [Ornithinibacillus gellani]TQS74514.1 SpoIIIAH-like family protein [Ornithinibacillus gellani]
MLKKQTVWLLTMLSLMIVLSAYYMLSDKNDDLAYLDQDKETSQDSQTNADGNDEAMANNTISTSGDEVFASIRMGIQDKRGMKKDRLKETIASSTATAEEKNEAKNEIDEINELDAKEGILEDTILANASYQDVLVRHEGDKVHVHVMVDSLSAEEAANIMQLVHDEFGEITVDVNFQKTEG